MHDTSILVMLYTVIIINLMIIAGQDRMFLGMQDFNFAQI